MKRIAYFSLILSVVLCAVFLLGRSKADITHTQVSAQTVSTDWPQLQKDAVRSGFTTATVDASRMRARWIWFGTDWILRNRSSETLPTWDDDLTSTEGKVLPMPSTVPFAFAESMQPIIVNNKLFVGDIKQNKVYALNFFDGSTIWSADNPGGSAWPGVATTDTVVFASMHGYVTAWDANSGAQKWRVDTGKTISHSPVLANSTVYVASQNGKVYAINLTNGAVLWQTDTGAPIQGGLAVANNRVYTGNETMDAIMLDATNGTIMQRTRLMGQSFRRTWPVIAGNKVIYQTVMAPFVGSEYVMNSVITGSDANFAAEQERVRTWLTGAGKLYEDLFVLDAVDLSKDFVVANGVIGGVGHHADMPVLNKNGVPLVWWPTYFGTISNCSFGCPSGYEIDIVGIDTNTGNGIQTPNSGATFTSTETDNTFQMTIANDTLFLRQNFRGTKAVDMVRKQQYRLSATYRYQDCGGWQAALNYAQGTPGCPPISWDGVARVPQDVDENLAGHVGPAIVPGVICFTEPFAVTCMEDY